MAAKRRPTIPPLSLSTVKRTDEQQSSSSSPSTEEADFLCSGPSSSDATSISPHSGHSVYMLVPAFCFSTPLSTKELKARCQDTLGVSQMEFLRVNSISPLEEDAPLAPPGVILTGFRLRNEDFTMDLVERTMKHNETLRETVERSAEALLTFEEKIQSDVELISSLREQVFVLQRQKSILEDRCTFLEQELSRYQRDETSTNGQTSLISSSTSDNNHTGHRRFLSGIHTWDTNCKPTSAPGSLIAPLLSPGRDHKRHGCRLCACPVFQPQQAISWICGCGHLSTKHVVAT
jgi:hypothetical protein